MAISASIIMNISLTVLKNNTPLKKNGVVTSFCTEGKLGIYAFPLLNIIIELSFTHTLGFG